MMEKLKLAEIFQFLALCLVLFGASERLFSQCPNRALDFDGNGDYIERLLTGSVFSPNSNFTAQMWFRSDATGTGAFRRLFSIGTAPGTGAGSRFEIGEVGGLLNIYWYAVAPPVNSIGPLAVNPINIRDGNWHCISVTRTATTVQIWLDGGTAPIYSAVGPTPLNSTQFRVGQWPGLTTMTEEWDGAVDNVRLWNYALPAADLMQCNPCPLIGNETGLAVYWDLDDGIALANNTGITAVADPNGNNGTLVGFGLTAGGVSNFVCGAPMVVPDQNLHLEIENPVGGANLTEICSGAPVNFCLYDAAGMSVPPATLPTTVVWEADCGSGFSALTDPAFSLNQFCFSVPAGVLLANCTTGSKGFSDCMYRAKISVTDPSGAICTFYSQNYPLRICCPVPAVGVVWSVVPPSAFMGTLCEGDVVTINVSLSGIAGTWIPPAPGSVATIDWCLNGVPIPAATGMTSFSYPITVGVDDLCFEVKIKNCACPLVTAKACIPVDPMPKCGLITGCDSVDLTLISTDCYDICPFRDAAVCMVNPTDFVNCRPTWQFSFDNITWVSLGITDPTWHTNTLPCDDTGSPYEWPAGQQCIYYRICGLPLSSPSGCDPCYSNTVKICLRKTPDVPIVSISDPKICKGGVAVLDVLNPEAGVTYEWFCNGISVGAGPSLLATNQACYWVVASNGCEKVESAQTCLTVCMVMATISCPLDPNPCAKLGQALYLSGCASTSTCGGPFTYNWVVSPAAPPLSFISPCEIKHLLPATGATYTLEVTDAEGCKGTASTTIIPCN